MQNPTSKMDLAPLAQRTAELSRSLATLGQRCEHSDTHSDIADIANESLRLSSTLWRLREAIEINKHKYTEVFSQDLTEISSELQLLCDEIAECCAEMQKMDTPGPVPWFFKKGRVSKLQKHLVALKTTLVVMRTVLHHSKDYGLHTSPYYLAEASPHIVQEDRAILDSIFAKNRHAIQALYDLDTAHQSSLSDFSQLSSGLDPQSRHQNQPHGRSISTSTSLGSPLLFHDLEPTNTPSSSPIDSPSWELQRRFSKRGTRLGVQMSILNMNPRETTAGLRERWLQVARSGRTSESSPNMQMPTKTPNTVICEHVDDGTFQEDGHLVNHPSTNSDSEGGGDAANHSEEEDDLPKAGGDCMIENSPDVTGDEQDYSHYKQHSSARLSGHSLKRLSSPATHAVRRLMKKLSFRRTTPGSSPKQMTFEDAGFDKVKTV